jgi:hypothetical protein
LKKWKNNVEVQGYVFEHTLNERTSKAGQNYIAGDLKIATDEEGLNVVTVHYGYVTPMTAKGNPNETYNFLQTLIQDNKTWISVGKANAQKVRVSSAAIEVNDFWSERDQTMVAPKRIRGSFCSALTGNITKPAVFDVDMVIDTVVHHEVENGDDYLELKGNVFDFRNNLIPLSLSVSKEEGIYVFEGMEISQKNPAVVHLWGSIVTNTVVSEETSKEEVAFGAPVVNTTSRKFQSWQVEGASVKQDFDSEATVTAEEFAELVQKRQEHVASEKTRQLEYRNRNSGFATATPASKVETPFEDGYAF